ncbi:hypothetical protein C4579_00535 [Candidatus Microgenomates bacterium]|nr:MAG: hypothetical protein C4579_00535 [Candidatus Microgenomates bacterium]
MDTTNFNNQQKKPKKAPQSDSLVEQLRDLGRGVGKTVTQDVVGGMASDALSSLFGTPKSGDMQPGQSVSLPKQSNSAAPSADFPMPPRMPRMNERFPFPFKKREQFKPQYSPEQMQMFRQQEAQVARKIEEVRQELKALIMEIKSVDQDVQQAVEQNIVDPDLYHINFFDRLKVMLKNMLQEIKDSRSWLTTHKSKKRQMGYWSQYKKKGTTFGLSHERTVATQTG